MFIHWFPGHMTKAIRAMRADMAIVDSVVYVLDARAPRSCINPAFDEIIGNKPRLYVLNKADTVPAAILSEWKGYFNDGVSECIALNSTQKGNAPMFIAAIKRLNAEKLERYNLRGCKKSIRAMVIGVPNCGKSTLINSLIAKKKTVTGDRPGVTRGLQWVAVDEYVDLVDTPGTLYPDFSDQKKAANLAIIGSIGDNSLDKNELALEILKMLAIRYPDQLAARYGFNNIEGDLLAAVAENKKLLIKGGEPDYLRAANTVIMDFRRQAFGKICLENPDGSL